MHLEFLPLTLVFGVFYLMKVKKMSMLKILLILIGVLSGWGINWILLTSKDGGKNHDTDYVFFSFRIAKSGT